MLNKLIGWYFVALFILMGILHCACSQDTQRGQKKQILLVQSYDANFPAYKDIKKILSKQLKEHKIKAEVYSFYLNSEQSPEKKQKLDLYGKLEKFSSQYPDVIIVNDDAALNALLTCDHSSIDSIPVVFMGVNYPNIAFIRKHSNINGFYNRPDYKTNVKLIEQLIGKCIIVRVTEQTYIDDLMLADMNEQLKDLCKINNIYSSDWVRLSGKNDNSLRQEQKVHPDAMYLSTINGKSSQSLLKGLGDNYYNKAYLATKKDFLSLLLGRFSAFPSFSVVNGLIGYNNSVVGGYVTPLEEQVVLAANRVTDILNGVPIENFPQITETGKKYIFDYQLLKQWGIDENKLPQGTLFVNMPFYIRYSSYLLVAVFILGGLFITIFVYQRILYKREAARKREAQERLEHEKAFLSFALESGNIYTFSYRRGIFEFDKEFYHSLGIPVEPIDADRFEAAIHLEEQDDFRLNRYKLDHGFPSRQITRRRYDFNGKGHQWWEFRYAQNTHLLNSSDLKTEEVEVYGLCLNIQQIKENEINLMHARKKAEESDRMKSVFLANMSHEIRTPLNAIVGFSQLLGSDMPLEPEQKTEFVSLISKNSDMLLKLINDILDLSRIESGRVSFTYEICNLNLLVEDVFRTHQLLMPEGVELRKSVPDIPAMIRTDRFRLTQVITNFINNATKFTKQGYIKLSYEYSEDNQYILISVTDTGIGIPKEKIDQVFERFQKLDEFAQGTGLGLAISQTIIKTFRGQIRLESEVGKGSKFTILLPNDSDLLEDYPTNT